MGSIVCMLVLNWFLWMSYQNISYFGPRDKSYILDHIIMTDVSSKEWEFFKLFVKWDVYHTKNNVKWRRGKYLLRFWTLCFKFFQRRYIIILCLFRFLMKSQCHFCSVLAVARSLPRPYVILKIAPAIKLKKGLMFFSILWKICVQNFMLIGWIVYAWKRN